MVQLMIDVNPEKLTDTAAFRLGVLGAIAADRFADRVVAYDVKPKHAGLLALLAAGAAGSQQEIARAMGIVPSLVVSLADHLEHLGAVGRERDPDDRRRQVLTLTERGRALLADCTAAAQAIDAELTAGLDAATIAAMHAALAALAGRAGLA